MSQLATIIITNPHAVIAVLMLAWVALARTHWQPAIALDAALIAVYWLRPSLGTLTLVPALWLVRWTPALASEAAALLGYPWHGMTAAMGRLLLPTQERPARHDRATLPPVQVATGATTRLEAPQIHARPMHSAEWFAACNDDPTAPHLGIIGPTQLGKTTFALALAGRRIGEFVITTTKPDLWAGADVTRPKVVLNANAGEVDWMPVIEAINTVHFEMLRRNVDHDTGAAPITLIIDEFTTTLGNVPSKVKQQILEIWSMGAASGVRAIVIAQEVNARAWGLEGRRDILGNLLFARVSTGRLWALGRLDPNGGLTDPRPLDTARLVALATEARLAGRGWRGAGAPSGSVPVVTPPTLASGNGTNGTGTGNEEAIIRALMKLRAFGVTREQARSMGLAFKDDNWRKAGERLGTAGNGMGTTTTP